MSLPMVVATLALCLAQLFIGAGLWWCLRRGSQIPVLELLGVGAVLGMILAVLVQQLVLLLPEGFGFQSAQWAWMVLLPVVTVLLIARRRHLVPVQGLRGWDLWAFLITAAIGLLLALPTILRTQRALAAVDTAGFNADLVFLEALGQSVSRYGIGDSVFLSGFGMRYHWLTYAWSGQLTNQVQAPAFAVLTAVLPVVLTVVAAALV
ncbi:MAG: hypothetical protein ACKOW5_16025, partial [Actinomycetales bacterium]